MSKDENDGGKSPQIEELLDTVLAVTTGRSRKDGICVFCGNDQVSPEDFRDECSRREWKISKLCQKCQDEVFGGDHEAENTG